MDDLQPPPDRSGRIIALIIAAHLLLTIPLGACLNIWLDEAYTLDTTGKSLEYALHQSLYFELQAPLYFILLYLVRAVNASVACARMFSVASVAAGLYVTGLLSRRYLRGIHPGWAVACAAFNPFIIRIATDMRLYGFTFLLVSLLLLTLHEGYLRDAPSRKARILHVILAIAVLYTQYYTGFLLAAIGAALLVTRRWNALWQYLMGMAVVAICLLPLVGVLRNQVSAHVGGEPIQEALADRIFFAYKRFLQYMMPPKAFPRLITGGFYVLVNVTLAALLLQFRRQLDTFQRMMIAITVFAGLSFTVLFNLLGDHLMKLHHSTTLFIPLMLTGFIPIALAPQPWRSRLAAGISTILLLFAFSSSFAWIRPMAKGGDYRRVAAFLEAHASAQEPVLVFHSGNALALSLYYGGPAPLVPLPRKEECSEFSRQAYEVKNENEIIEALARVGGAKGTAWLVVGLEYPQASVLKAYIDKNFEVESTTAFFNSDVLKLRPRTMQAPSQAG